MYHAVCCSSSVLQKVALFLKCIILELIWIKNLFAHRRPFCLLSWLAIFLTFSFFEIKKYIVGF